MSQFGQLVRDYRIRCTDPQTGKTLTQERLAELLGYTPQAVSLWERGRSKIHADDRHVLVSLLKILHDYAGMQSLSEANALLSAGNYRLLDDVEQRQVFPDAITEAASQSQPAKSNGQRQTARLSLRELFLQSINEELHTLLTEAAEGPSPPWPRILVAVFRWLFDRLTSVHVARALLWMWVWLLTWWIISPSLRWPFIDQEQAREAMVLYAGGSLILPLFIGVLTSTQNNEFWQRHNLATAGVTRLYTYQGAFIGFYLGYMAIFAFSLGGYSLGIRQVAWLDLAAAMLPVGLGYAGARLVPYNLWRAYGRLRISDGAIFFIFLLVGPCWSAFVYGFYPWLLTPDGEFLIFMSAATILAGTMAWRQHRTGTSIIPSYWWVIIYGTMLTLYEATQTANLFDVVSLAGLIVAFAVLLAQERIRLTLVGSIGLLIGSGLLAICFWLNVWLGVVVAGVMALAWWRWGRKFVWLPLVFWGVVIAVGLGSWLVRRWPASDVLVSLGFSLVTLLMILWRRK